MLKSRKSRRNQKLKRTNTQHKQKVQVEDEPVDDEMTNISVVNTLKDGNVVIYSEVLEVETNEIDETMESRESQRIVANCAEYVDEVQIQYEPVEDGYESENDVNMAAVEAEIDLTSHVEVIKTEVDASTHADEEMLRELRDEMMEMSCGVTATELNQPRLENEGCDLHIENDDNTTTVETQMQNYIDEAKMKEFNDEILQVMGDLEKLSKMGKEKRRENHVRHLCTSHITYTMGLLECHLFWDHKMKGKFTISSIKFILTHSLLILQINRGLCIMYCTVSIARNLFQHSEH